MSGHGDGSPPTFCGALSSAVSLLEHRGSRLASLQHDPPEGGWDSPAHIAWQQDCFEDLFAWLLWLMDELDAR